MFNRSEILRTAWANYRRDVFKGWGVRRGEGFNRSHFAYCLRTAWALAKEAASAVASAAARRLELIREAGTLNNHPDLVNADHVSIMGMMDADECERHVARLRSRILTKPSAAAAARAGAVRSALLDLEMGDFINWTQHSALQSELAQLTA